MTRTAAALLCAILLAACAHKRAEPTMKAETTAGRVPHAHEIDVADDIRKACNIEEQDRAPKFDYDAYDLLPADRDVLAQVARCLTVGPLKGRSIELVGRADPRGETEYNMVLGESRAGSVSTYLSALGVDGAKMLSTSRGELDAQGVDEDSWQLDRRVDLRLQSRKVSALR